MNKSEFEGFTSTPQKAKKPQMFLSIFFSLLILVAVFVGAFKLIEIVIANSNSNPDVPFPRIELSLADVTIEQIDAGDKDTKYPGNTITFVTKNLTTTFENVEVKGRGNATWDQIKKPYQIKLNEKENLFNFGEGKKWILLANYLDPSMLRTDAAFYLERMIQKGYALDGTFVELYIDNNYHGLYYLSEKVEIGKDRVNLDDPHGVLAEIDNVYGVWEGCHRNKNDDCIVVKELVNEDNPEDGIKILVNDLNTLEEAVKKKDFGKISNLIDVDSFVEYYLLNEFIVNPDAYSTSFYLSKNGMGDKIHAGPGWDFDLSFGNKSWSAQWVNKDTFYSPFETMVMKSRRDETIDDGIEHKSSISTLLYDLMDVPEFESRVKKIYQETMSGKKEEFLNYIKSQADYIHPAAIRNQERWKLKTNFDEEVDYLLDWASKRYDHFEETYGQASEEPKEESKKES